MKKGLELTGERMIEDAYHQTLGGYVIYLLHAASYQFAEKFCADRRVLDLGCGSGYGASWIAKVASSVHAVDISEEAVRYAAEHYARTNLEFSRIDPDRSLPFQDKSFDVVLSFQVIEHVVDHHAYLAEAARVLKADGVLVLITPDRKHRLLPMQRPWNRWHLREYGMAELCSIVEARLEIKQALEMGARADVAMVELDRYRKLKWIMLPFTLPVFPEVFRRAALDFIHRLKGGAKAIAMEAKAYPFGVEVIDISEKVDGSLNLVIVAGPKRAGE